MNAHPQTSVSLGRLSIAFDGITKISRHVTDEIAAALPSAEAAPHLAYRFVSRAKRNAAATPINVLRGLDVGLIQGEEGTVFEVAARPMAPDWIIGSDLAIKALEMNYLTLDELRAKNFVYKLFNWSTQIRQLDLGQSYIHASALTKDGRTIAVLGKGGIGKTSAMLKLCIQDQWKYLSDDLAVIDDEGTVYRSPTRLQVYAYNTESDPELERRLMNGRYLPDRLQWSLRRRLRGTGKVRRRVSAEFLFGADGVAESAPLTDLVFLERGAVSGCQIHDIDGTEAAARMAPIVMDEIKAYAAVYAEVPRSTLPSLPNPVEVEERTHRTLERAFSGASARLMTAGPEIGPPDLANALRDILHNSKSGKIANG